MTGKRLAWLGALTFLAGFHPVASAASGRTDKSALLYAAMEVGIAADGSVVKVEPDSELPQLLRDLLIARVSQWRFEPPQWQGASVSTSTHLLLRLQMVPVTDGGSALRIVFREYEKGGRFKYGLPTQNYPLKAIRKKKGGDFVYAVRIGEDGVPVGVERKFPIELVDEYVEAMDQESQRSIMRALWRPFLAEGRAVACTYVYAVHFSMDEAPPPVRDTAAIRAMVPDDCPAGELRTKIDNTML